jgi:hypothetical protein
MGKIWTCSLLYVTQWRSRPSECRESVRRVALHRKMRFFFKAGVEWSPFADHFLHRFRFVGHITIQASQVGMWNLLIGISPKHTVNAYVGDRANFLDVWRIQCGQNLCEGNEVLRRKRIIRICSNSGDYGGGNNNKSDIFKATSKTQLWDWRFIQQCCIWV